MKNTMEPATTGPMSMTAYLEGMLKELELAQGGQDAEAAAALAELKEKMAVLARAEAAPQSGSLKGTADAGPTDELQLARDLDRLDDRLRELEAELNSADEPTKQILQRSTALWLGSKSLEEDKSDDENGPIGGTSKTSF